MKLSMGFFNFLRLVRGKANRIIRNRQTYFIFSTPRRSVKPISIKFGYDRGKPVDRYYIESFLQTHKQYIKGNCLEVTDDYYIQKFGNKQVTKTDVLDINLKNRSATIHGDLRDLKDVADNIYDCLIITQVYQMIDDFESAIRESKRILKRGGVLLTTLPSLGPVFNIKNNCWRFTVASSQYVFGKYFKGRNLKIKSYGNALSGQAYWVGMSQEDLTQKELEFNDPYFPLIVAIFARKA